MQREERGLGQETDRHQCGRNAGGGVGTYLPGQEGDIQGPIGSIEQRHTEEIEHRAREREEEIAQSGSERFGPTIETHERNCSERQELERDIEIEQVVAEEHGIKRSPHRKQKRPEHKRSAGLGHTTRCAEIAARE